MKNRKLYSIVAAAGIMVTVLPVMAADSSKDGIPQEPYVAGVGVAPGKCSSSTVAEHVDFSQLPPPVKATVQAQRGADVITAINSETQNGRIIYHVQFKGHSDHARPELVVASDGTILKGKHASKPANLSEVTDAPVNR
jgi:hypothetical protein